jgi:HSP20 family molecular chaperone IbpA
MTKECYWIAELIERMSKENESLAVQPKFDCAYDKETGVTTVYVEMSGISKENISVYFENNKLKIHGKKEILDPEKNYRFTMYSGVTNEKEFLLELPLSKDITYLLEKTEAKYENGILIVFIFKDMSKLEKNMINIQ